MPVCDRCGHEYRKGTYFSHRMSNDHKNSLRSKQKRFGSRFIRCTRCGGEYAPGNYTTHVEEEAHINSTIAGEAEAGRAEALKMYRQRDEAVKEAVLSGLTYTDIGRQLGISRQRAHQIAKGLGVKQVKPAIMPFNCFVCHETYRDWIVHEASGEHRLKLAMMKTYFKKYRVS